MRKVCSKVLFALTLTLLGASAFCAQPASVRLIEEVILPGDVIYGHYVVTCDNDAKKDVSAWDNKKLWCIGKGEKATCEKKKIKIAKKICRGL